MPYKIPWFEESSAETNGNVVDSGEVGIFVATSKASMDIGKVEFKPSAVCSKARLVMISLEAKELSKVVEKRSSSLRSSA